jgi:hypothetical protein
MRKRTVELELTPATPLHRLTRLLGWTRASYVLMSAFVTTLALIVVVWWPLVEELLAYLDPRIPWWLQVDWLLLGLFAAMSLLIMAGADIRADVGILLVGLAGGLVIESWGTQTSLWTYYTLERPPLWIIPAWPIASLSIDRLVRLLRRPAAHWPRLLERAYLPVFVAYYALMLAFVWPTLDKPFTWLALALCAGLIASPGDRRPALLHFAAGSGLGYFLELWGTTRACWTYYTLETPPLFAVLAHGMAALAFWRAGALLRRAWGTLAASRLLTPARPPDSRGGLSD